MDDCTPIKTIISGAHRGPPWFSHISWFFYLLNIWIIGKSWVYKSSQNIQDNIGSNHRSWQFDSDVRKFQGASQELSKTSATIFPFFLDRKISIDWLGIDSPWLNEILSINALKCSRMKNFCWLLGNPITIAENFNFYSSEMLQNEGFLLIVGEYFHRSWRKFLIAKMPIMTIICRKWIKKICQVNLLKIFEVH